MLIMNKIKYVLVLLAAISFIGCKKYLDVTPQGKVLPKTDAEFAALIHTHVNEIEGGEDENIVGNFDNIISYESFSDNLDANVKIGNIPAYVGVKINTFQLDYKNYFSVIRDCNIVLENLLDRNTELAKKTCAAAYAIKGVCYYNLIRIYCEPYDPAKADTQLGMPLIDKFDMEERPARASLKETVAYCEKMLKAAIDYNITDDFFLFTSNIEKAYLAKLYFWSQDWKSCSNLCEELMKVSAYKLASIADYTDMIQTKNGWKQEVIVRSHINNNSDIDWYYTSIIKDVKTRPVNATLIKLFANDKDKDVRYSLSFDSKRINTKNTSSKIRGSELVLMLAECYYHESLPGKALEQLNYLRRNRITGVTDYQVSTLPEINSNSIITTDCTGAPLTKLLSAIFDERRKELYMEGDRWFELKRNGRPEMWVISDGLKYTTYKYLYTAPIYKGDVDLNSNMVQNEGYEK